ncbi:hypothetical protein BJ170DRAFT_296178 [Xylariales sp. AK1849]|nr:hypothetical protein BJ170DRAFT_296178 [Xylariales sp. AK1849]
MHLARPRVVRISTIDFVKKIHFRANSLGNRASNIQWYTTNKLPVLTRVCQEARAETLNFYRVHLSQDQRTFYFSPVYLNPEWDMVLLNCTHDAFPMDIFLSDVLAYDPKGVGVVHLGSYVDPGKWDCAPLPGCAALDESTKNMESYTQCTYVGSLKVDVYPILKVGEGYLLESVAVDRSKFVTYMPHVGRYPRLPPDRSLEIEDQLARLLPVELMQRLRMQTLFSRTHSSRMDASTRSLATNERAAGLVVWNKERDGREWDGVREYTYFSCN